MKGERSDFAPWCKGDKGEAGTIVFFSRRNATTVIKGEKGKRGDKGPRGDDGSHGRTGSPGAPGYRGTKGKRIEMMTIDIDHVIIFVFIKVTRVPRANLGTEESPVRIQSHKLFD